MTEITLRKLNNQKTFKAQCKYVKGLLDAETLDDKKYNKDGLEEFKKAVCEDEKKADDKKKDDKKSGFQTNILSVALIALCTLFKY